MKPHAIHIPLADREKRNIEKSAKALGLTQGEYVRKLLYGKIDAMEAVRRIRLSDGVVVKIKTPEMRSQLVLKRGRKK